MNPDNTDCNGASCVDQALASNFDTIVLDPTDNSFEAKMTLTAHHWGWVEFRLCRQGGRGADGQGVTQECSNQDVLEFDAEDARQRYAGQMNTGVEDPSDYIGTSASVRCDGPDADLKLEAPQIWSPPGSCCYGGGDCGNSNTSRTQNKRFVVPKVAAGPEYKVRVRLPAALSCSQEAPCTLQWTYMTGNSVDSYPEVFRNCADFKLGSSDTVAPAPTPVPTESELEPQPEPEPEPTPAPTPAATPAPTTAASSTAGPAPTECGSCSGCLASNGVCYPESKAFCDLYPQYTWCAAGVSSTVAPSSESSTTSTAAPTAAPTPAPTAAPTPSPAPASGSCVDVQGTQCSQCMASNNVCYAQPKAWCDTFSYHWCGSTSLLQQAASPAPRLRGFLAPVQMHEHSSR